MLSLIVAMIPDEGLGWLRGGPAMEWTRRRNRGKSFKGQLELIQIERGKQFHIVVGCVVLPIDWCGCGLTQVVRPSVLDFRTGQDQEFTRLVAVSEKAGGVRLNIEEELVKSVEQQVTPDACRCQLYSARCEYRRTGKSRAAIHRQLFHLPRAWKSQFPSHRMWLRASQQACRISLAWLLGLTRSSKARWLPRRNEQNGCRSRSHSLWVETREAAGKSSLS